MSLAKQAVADAPDLDDVDVRHSGIVFWIRLSVGNKVFERELLD